ncbi:hypothetical protein QQG55_48580 [Brugia pahangi]
MRLFFEIYALFWIPLDDICRRNNAIMNCKYVRVYPLQQKSTEMSITCVNGDVCYQCIFSLSKFEEK